MTAATALFAVSGYHDTSIQAITQKAGVATGTFYLYFSSKESCFLAIIDDLYRAVMQAVLEARSGSQSATDKLLASVAAATATLLENTAAAGLVLRQLHGGIRILAERVTQVETDLVSLIAQDLSDASIADDAYLRATFIVGGLELLLRLTLDRHQNGTSPQETARRARFYVKSLIM